MKLNNKGFAISTIMYMILIMAISLIVLTLSVLSSRKMIVEKIRKTTLDNIYNVNNESYRSVLGTLKEEVIAYATAYGINKASIKISDFNTSIDSAELDSYDLSNKYLTIKKENGNYNVYLGSASTISNINSVIDDFIDIVDYKIYGNSIQQAYTGKNLLNKEDSVQAGIRNETAFTSWGQVAFNHEWVLNNLEPSTQYTLSYDMECISVPEHDANFSNNLGLFLYSGVSGYSSVSLMNAQYLEQGGTVHKTITFTTPATLHDAEANYRILAYTNRYTLNGNGVHSSMIFSNIQLEKGSTATAYEPYVGGEAAPNPNYPQEIVSVGNKVTDSSSVNYNKYEIPITLSNRNIVKEVNSTNFTTSNYSSRTTSEFLEEDDIKYVHFERTDVSGTDTAFSMTSSSFNVEPGAHYTVSAYMRGTMSSLAIHSSAHVYDCKITWSDSTTTNLFTSSLSINTDEEWHRYTFEIDVPSGVTSGTITFGADAPNMNSGQYIDIGNIQIELGTQATPYVEYKEPYTYSIYLNEPLRKIGTYIDNVRFSTSNVTRNIKELAINSSRSFSGPNEMAYYIVNFSDMYSANVTGSTNISLCSHFKYNTGTWNNTSVNHGYVINLKNYQIRNNDYTTLNDFKDWLDTEDVRLAYQLATATEAREALTPMGSFESYNAIAIGTELQPSSAEFTIVKQLREL